MATEATPLLATTTAPVPSPSTWRETLSFAARYLVPPRSDPQSYALILGAVMATLAVAPARLLPELLAQRAVDAVFGGAADPARGAAATQELAARIGAGAVALPATLRGSWRARGSEAGEGGCLCTSA
jgi:hypothetical protein